MSSPVDARSGLMTSKSSLPSCVKSPGMALETGVGCCIEEAFENENAFTTKHKTIRGNMECTGEGYLLTVIPEVHRENPKSS